MNLSEKKLNIYYSFLQIAYWVTSAVVFCFTTVFLQFRGYSNYEIGIVFAVGNIIGFVSQPLIAGYIDRSDRRTLLRCIRITAVLAVLLMLAVYLLPSGSVSLIVAYALLVAGNTLLNPLCISLSFYIESWGAAALISAVRGLSARCRMQHAMLYSACSCSASVKTRYRRHSYCSHRCWDWQPCCLFLLTERIASPLQSVVCSQHPKSRAACWNLRERISALCSFYWVRQRSILHTA